MGSTLGARLVALEAARLADAKALTGWFQRAIVANRDRHTLTLADISPIADALFTADPTLLGRLILSYRALGLSTPLLDTWPDGGEMISA